MALLKFGDRDAYMPSLEMMEQRYSAKELRAEYTRLRNIANARLERLGRSEFADSQVYLTHADRYPSIKEFGESKQDRRAIVMGLSELAGFVSAEGSSVRGLQRIRARTIETLHERGYTFVNKKNFKEFADWMEESRIKKLNKIYDSERVAELYTIAKKHEMNLKQVRKDFELYLKKIGALKKMKMPKHGKKVNMKKLKEALLKDD